MKHRVPIASDMIFLPFYWARPCGGRFQVLFRRAPGADEVVLDFLPRWEIAERLASHYNIIGRIAQESY